MKKYELKNGITVLYFQMKYTYSVVIGLAVKAGAAFENENTNGITHFLEHLHFRRLNDISQDELYFKMDKIGGNIKAETYKELLRFSMKVRPKYLCEALDILENILTANRWSEDEIECERKTVLNELNEKRDFFNMESLADEIILKGTSFERPVIGNERSIKSFEIKDVLLAKETFFSAGNIALVVTGNFSDNDMDLINRRLEKVKVGENKNFCEFKSNKIKPIIKYVKSDLTYPCSVMSFFVDERVTEYELSLLNSILGGGTGARLQKEIREKHGFSYDIYSYTKEYSGLHLLNISFSAEKSSVCCALEEIIRVLNNMKVDISVQDMESNIHYYTDNLWYLLESPDLINENLCWEIFSKNGIKTVREKIDKYNSIDINHLMKISTDVFIKENCSLIIAGDIEKEQKTMIRKIIKGLT